MKILFLGDVVGNSGCLKLIKNLPSQIKKNKIDFVIVNGENAAEEGVGITEKIYRELLTTPIDVMSSGNHIYARREVMDRLVEALIDEETLPGDRFMQLAGLT